MCHYLDQNVISPRSRSQYAHTENLCPGHNSGLPCWIYIIFHTIVANDLRMCLDTRSLSWPWPKVISPRSQCTHTENLCPGHNSSLLCWIWIIFHARRGGAEVAGWTLDRKIRVRFPTYPHRVWALWWQGNKRRLRTSRCPCRGRLGTLKTPSCPWRGCPAAGQNLETGHLSRHYIAEISLNVTLNHNQQQQ